MKSSLFNSSFDNPDANCSKAYFVSSKMGI